MDRTRFESKVICEGIRVEAFKILAFSAFWVLLAKSPDEAKRKIGSNNVINKNEHQAIYRNYVRHSYSKITR